MTLVCDTPHAQAVHALVIGVGDYPWLLNGSQPTFSQHGGMGQLTSAPVSACDFAKWFLSEFSHPSLAGKSLELLISDPTTRTFSHAGADVNVERATMANVTQAVLRWFARGNADEDSLLIFFFCGHGLGKGRQTILLMDDFGSLPGPNSLRLALDFDAFLLGMDQCKARQQCFFADACRVGTPFTLNALQYFGDPIIIPGAQVINRTRSAPVFYSALPGTTAYGRPNQPSFFTDALLKAFKGAGADDQTGSWRVDSDNLPRGINAHLRRSVQNTPAKSQLSTADGIADPIALHRLQTTPLVPVEVTCDPENHNQVASLNVAGSGSPPLLIPAVPKGSWHLDLSFGTYDFGVTLPPPPQPIPAQVRRSVRPPYQLVELVVQ